ncbi:arginine ABC transporter ATP-binding protein [Arthrobacter sp. RIT-PI-e]|uniref:amino acid ABC transporter ATP-binding protein n=1 Tax=Arthrobacter sp. RIT-PI-e TaxID=1681197 RepID=UPI0006769757|nr:amino acid ABC transporter ATP-binding protein [Arthrobacter sp. RIT-PI-e]KNC17833.1 arginine ABC transporter ATP-binding protein [Arthrobacter sp. RIT-PI-e]
MSTTVENSTLAPALVRVRDLHKSFGSLKVLEGIDLDVAAGSVTCILGPSGSGKSTLLRCMNRLETPERGTVEVADQYIGYSREGDRLVELSDKKLSRQRTSTAMVFQRFNLFAHMSALQNVMEGPLHVLHRSKKEASEQAHHLLEQVGLAERAHHLPAQLSGGQQQRVAIARALAMDPQVVLFDEPTSALDPELVGDVLTVMTDLASAGLTMIVVTHEIQFAREAADTVVFMDGGKLVEQGPPGEVLVAPRHERTREFLRRVL